MGGITKPGIVTPEPDSSNVAVQMASGSDTEAELEAQILRDEEGSADASIEAEKVAAAAAKKVEDDEAAEALRLEEEAEANLSDEEKEAAAAKKKEEEEAEANLSDEEKEAAAAKKKEEEEAAEEAAEAKRKEEEEDDGKITPEVQAIIDKRIGKEVGKTKALKEELETARLESEENQERVVKLTALLDSESDSIDTSVHPLLQVKSEKDIDTWLANYHTFRRFARENRDGAEAEDGTKYSAEDVAAKLDAWEEAYDRYLPQAREILKKRETTDEEGKKLYPELYDSKSKESLDMRLLLREIPVLSQVADRTIIGDILAGRKARKGKKAEPNKTEKKKTKVKGSPPEAPVTKNVVIVKKDKHVTTKKGDGSIDIKKMVDGGNDIDSLAQQLDQ